MNYESACEYAYMMAANTSFIKDNYVYSDFISNTKFIYSDSDVINAYAQSLGVDKHRVTILEGLCKYFMKCSYPIARYMNDKDCESFRSVMHQIASSENYEIDVSEFDTNNAFANDVNSIWYGMILSVIGHEMGHICLGHTLRSGSEDLEIIRNNERQADLFASNIVESTPYKYYNVVSALMVEVAFCWINDNYDGSKTHPASRERVYNILNNHKFLLRDFGITENTIDLFLP